MGVVNGGLLFPTSGNLKIPTNIHRSSTQLFGPLPFQGRAPGALPTCSSTLVSPRTFNPLESTFSPRSYYAPSSPFIPPKPYSTKVLPSNTLNIFIEGDPT